MQAVRLNIFQIVDLLEMKEVDLSFLASSSYRKMLEGWQHFQAEAKRQRKRLAKKYHPDVGGDQKKMQEINQIVDLVLRVKPAPPQPTVRIVSVNVYGSSWTDYWGSGFSSTTISYY